MSNICKLGGGGGPEYGFTPNSSWTRFRNEVTLAEKTVTGTFGTMTGFDLAPLVYLNNTIVGISYLVAYKNLTPDTEYGVLLGIIYPSNFSIRTEALKIKSSAEGTVMFIGRTLYGSVVANSSFRLYATSSDDLTGIAPVISPGFSKIVQPFPTATIQNVTNFIVGIKPITDPYGMVCISNPGSVWYARDRI